MRYQTRPHRLGPWLPRCRSGSAHRSPLATAVPGVCLASAEDRIQLGHDLGLQRGQGWLYRSRVFATRGSTCIEARHRQPLGARSPCATMVAMERIAVRELRNQASRLVRRARAGERLIITVDGVPAAEIGPISAAERASSLEELITTGAIVAPRVRTTPRRARPVRAPSSRSSSDVLHELREG